MAITYPELLERFSFSPERDPFKSVNAAEERLFLPEYFVAPPFFESVWGNPQAPRSCVVFAPTGAGKTAQVIMIQDRASSPDQPDVLTLLYDDFEKQGISNLVDASTKNHLHALTRIGTVALLTAIGQLEFGSIAITQSEREQVQYLASRYIGGASEENIVAALKAIRTPVQKLTERVSSLATAVPFVAAGLKFFNMEPASVTIMG